MDCRVFRYCNDVHHRFALVSLNEKHALHKNALVLIPGLSDGILSLRFTEHLSDSLLKIGYSMVQVNLASSFYQFGFSSIEGDCEELGLLVMKLKRDFDFDKIVLLGHSTGAQDVVYYMRHGKMVHAISAVVLQGAVSDRDSISVDENIPSMIEEAKLLESQGKGHCFVDGKHCDAPITAARLLSLVGRLTPDDAFSVDLTTAELEQIFSGVKVPTMLCFSCSDEYVLDRAAQRELAKRMVEVLKKHSKVDCIYFPGDHGLTEPQYFQPFVLAVCDFLLSM